MKRPCDACGRTYTAKTKRSRYCDRADCRRKRARLRKNGRAKVIALRTEPVPSQPEPVEPAASVEDATRAELEAAGKLSTSAGRAAMALARRLDAGDDDTGSSLAALAKQLHALMAEVLKGVKIPDNPVDELRARRERRLRGA